MRELRRGPLRLAVPPRPGRTLGGGQQLLADGARPAPSRLPAAKPDAVNKVLERALARACRFLLDRWDVAGLVPNPCADDNEVRRLDDAFNAVRASLDLHRARGRKPAKTRGRRRRN